MNLIRTSVALLATLVAVLGCGSATTNNLSPAPVSEANMQLASDYCAQQKSVSFLVLADGKTLREQYFDGATANQRNMLASGTKSFTGMMAMFAVQDKLLMLDNPASESLTEWKADPPKSKITYRQLLNLTSGLTPGEMGSATNSESWAAIIAEPMVYAPGERFNYGAYQLNAFGLALQRKLNGETVETYLKRKIFDPLGITAEWRFRCADGNPQLGGGVFMTARDWAMFGEFVRNQGKYNGQQLLDPALLAECFKPTQPQNPAYGLTWWLKQPVSQALILANPTVQEVSAIANAAWVPADLVMAAGAGKQRLYVIPSLNLVVVRQGRLAQGFEDAEFLSLLLRGKKASE